MLGGIDTTGRYLVPEYGEFFFYLAVIVDRLRLSARPARAGE